ncbi:hypothetical protein JCM11641_005975 [Rhodosporidiobolus odoratus]
MKTQALVVQHVGAPYRLKDVQLEEPQANEVLVKVTACGLCHTDLLVSGGGIPTPFPCILGHEGSGIVLSVGSSVQRVQPGDHVLLSFSSCGECGCCTDEPPHPAGCEEFVRNNFGRHRNTAVGGTAAAKDVETGGEVATTFFGQSTLARHALVVESSCVKVPAGTDLVSLAPLGCGLQSGAGAVLNILRPAPTSSIAIFGLGAVGFAALWAAVHLKIQTIIVVDLFPNRLELAKKHGATHLIDGKDAEVVKRVKEATGGRGAKYAVECTGVTKVLGTAWESLANFGHVISVGNPGPGIQPPVTIHDAVNHSRTWSGLAEGDSNPPEFIPLLMRLYEEGAFPVNDISQPFPVEDFEAAVAAMKTGAVIKPIITF